jgi:hypothetical protein
MAVRIDLDFGVKLYTSDRTAPRLRQALSNILGNAPFRKRLTDGTADGEIDLIYHRDLAIGAGATVTRIFEGSLADEWGNTLTFVEIVGGGVLNAGSVSTKTISYGPNNHANGMLAFVANVTDMRVCYPGLSDIDPGIDFFYAPRGVACGTVGAGNQNTWQFTNNDGVNGITADEASFFIFGRSAAS